MFGGIALSSLCGSFLGPFVVCPGEHCSPPYPVSVVSQFLRGVAVEAVFVVEVAVRIAVTVVEVFVNEERLFQFLVQFFLKSGGFLVVLVFGDFVCGGEGFSEAV